MNQTQLDLSLFRWIESQTSESDRKALLSIKEAVCSIVENYRYLEVGSHLGGSLQPHVVDTRCSKIFSVDPRPLEQTDERTTRKYRYEGNSTARMLGLLSKIPAADISKIQTFEVSSWELSPTSLPALVDFAFIDGEHTHSAVVQDFISVRGFLSPVAVLAFHDCFVTPSALLKISQTLRREHHTHWFQYFPHSNIVAVIFGSARLNVSLLNFGWQPGLPISRWYCIKHDLRRRLPRFFSVLDRCRRYFRGKQHA